MKALVYAGPGKKELREMEKPTIINDGDAVVKSHISHPNRFSLV